MVRITRTRGGYTLEELYADPQLVFKWIHPADRHLLEPTEGFAQPLVLRWLRKDQTILWIEQRNTPSYDDQGRLLAIDSIARDVTQRKQAEEALQTAHRELQTSEDRLRSILDNTSAVVFMKDLQGRYLFVNKEYEELFHVSNDTIQGMTDYDIFPAEYAAMFQDNDQLALASDAPIQTDESVPHDDGIHFYISVKFPLRHLDGRPYAVCGIATDITERKKFARELEKLEWLLRPKEFSVASFSTSYGDITKLNTNRTILDALGAETIHAILSEFMGMLESSSAVYEINGDYATGIFSSGWCQLLDSASYKLCRVENASDALACGRWLCHESCWKEATLPAIESGLPNDIECEGGIRLYAIPIRIGDKTIGGINFGYGSPPKSREKLTEISEKYMIDINELSKMANAY